jgi:hypothetical protein
VSWWHRPLGQFVRIVGAAMLVAGVKAAAAHLGVLDIPLWVQAVGLALLHAADESLSRALVP